MPTSVETLLAELTREVRANTEGYIRFESTFKTELEGLRSDIIELKETNSAMARTQATHAERLIASETRISDLQQLRQDLNDTRTDLGALRERVIASAPVRTPWTAIGSLLVAAMALAWTLFGR